MISGETENNIIPIDLLNHLDHLDGGNIVSLTGGDNSLMELLQDNINAPSRGTLILNLIGGAQSLLEDPRKRRALLLTFSGDQRRTIFQGLNVNRDDFNLTPQRRTALYHLFGLPEPAQRTTAPHTFSVVPATVSYGLFPHQSAVLLMTSNELETPPGRVMLHMPTGSGKTRTAMHLIARHMNARKKSLVIWVVSGLELCVQASEEFEAAWQCLGERSVPIIKIWQNAQHVDDDAFAQLSDADRARIAPQLFTSERWPIGLDDGFIVASVDSIRGLLELFNPREKMLRMSNVTLTVFDEAHRTVAPTYSRVIEDLVSSGAKLLGLSATPGRRHHDGANNNEQQELVGLFNSKIVSLTIDGYNSPIQGLIDLGFLARLEKEELQIPNDAMTQEQIQSIQQCLSNSFELSPELLRTFGLNPTRNLAVAERVVNLVRQENHRRVIVFAPSVESAVFIAHMLNTQGINAAAISADSNVDERKGHIDAFRGTTAPNFVLCNFNILSTGFDAPATSAVVIARPTNSIVLLSQMAGRALRGPKVKGNETAKLVTVVDTCIPELVETIAQFHAFDDLWTQGRDI